MRRDLELYIHIPFCVKKCAYCDFLSPRAADTIEKYVQALIREIESVKIERNRKIQSGHCFCGWRNAVCSFKRENRLSGFFRQSRKIRTR